MNLEKRNKSSKSDIYFDIRNADYSIVCGFTEKQILMAYKLRYETFCCELKWVPKVNSCQEIDRVDEDAFHIGVFKGEELVAYLRCLSPNSRWMINREFVDINQKNTRIFQPSNSCEVTRLLVKKKYRCCKFENNITPAEALYQGLFTFCMLSKYRFVYMTISSLVLRALNKRGLPCFAISEEKNMDDGVVTINGVLDWNKFLSISHGDPQVRKKQYLNTYLQAKLSIK